MLTNEKLVIKEFDGKYQIVFGFFLWIILIGCINVYIWGIMPQHDFDLKPLWENIIGSMKIDACKASKFLCNSLLQPMKCNNSTLWFLPLKPDF